MPKKAVAIFFLAAFIGAAIYVYFTFPRTKDEIPQSNNQRDFPSPPVPNSVPVPETVPHPNTPHVPPGPTLRVMAWAAESEAGVLQKEADAFAAATGRRAFLTIDGDPVTYRHDLQDALASDTPPDVCLIAARDFSGTDPARDLADAAPNPGSAPRSIAAFTVNDRIKAVPDEFSVELLFYNPAKFDEAGLGYPGRHWTWDTLEAISRALASLRLQDDAGDPVYPVELPADFDFWNVLCTQAGHPALDLNVWHLADAGSRESQIRALDFIHEYFQDSAVAAPLPKAHEAPWRLFAMQQAALLIAPSQLTASLPKFRYGVTVLPSDMARASLARVNGWAVTAKSTQQEAARVLAAYLAWQPVHAGWRSVQKPATGDGDSPDAICYEALGQAVIPRLDPQTAPMAEFLDQQIDLLARDSGQTSGDLYARIQTKFQNWAPGSRVESESQGAGLKPMVLAPATGPLRGL